MGGVPEHYMRKFQWNEGGFDPWVNVEETHLGGDLSTRALSPIFTCFD